MREAHFILIIWQWTWKHPRVKVQLCRYNCWPHIRSDVTHNGL